MSDKYTLLASHMQIYASISQNFREKYSKILEKSDPGLVSKIIDDYKKMSLSISPESFAYEYLASYSYDLKKRAVDKNIPAWYAYGRSQGLNDRGLRLYLPYIASKVHTSLSREVDEMFAAGYAIYNDNKEYLSFLSEILSSDLFAYYISMVSKPYSQGYYSTAKSQVKKFSVPSELEYERIIKSNWNKNIYELYSLNTSEIKKYHEL
ncbi:hypothetical protein VL4N_06490 [Vagococcus lutrae]|uniref:hypothetical protein n=1 Tax=Vagococcus lutrae TaxID=81947 RepID=UPI0019253848|nr:hypothetical protein [Vagococcus lutrae]GEQ61664.1 hypothetical protein VL2N_10000 [Vagococcus lutrae]GEQ63207.1 hypothetical protein VL3N_06490 [Vagococcus lutrae]GEQ65099.1 hypothetical protein VL4N_06490 [Vagococcus lutrae]